MGLKKIRSAGFAVFRVVKNDADGTERVEWLLLKESRKYRFKTIANSFYKFYQFPSFGSI